MTTKTSSKLSRRQVLAGLGTIGVASAGAGLGTTAFFSDTERLQGWYEAGRVDLILDYRSTYKPWERYDLHMVPEDQRPAIVKDSGGMTYEIGAAPAIRYVDSGEALSHEEWGRVVTGLTDVPTACNFDDPTDISNSLPARFETLAGATYLPGYVDGQDNDGGAPVMYVDLDDIKPYDEGETTFSIHLCGNPSFVTARLLDAVDDENVLYEPEIEAGEPEDEAGVFEGGELGDYLYVVVSADPDCDNLSANTILGESDTDDLSGPVDIDEDFDVVTNNVLYAGSFKGWVSLLESGFELPPTGGSTGANGSNGGIEVQPLNGSTTAHATYCGPFSPGAQVQQCIDCLPCDEPAVLGQVSGLSGFTYDGEIPEGTTHVTLKAATACYLAAVTSDTEEIEMPESNPTNEPNQYGEISNATFYQCDGEIDTEGDPEPGDCFKPGVHCYAMEWYLPCMENDDGRFGFTDLPIYNAVDQDGNPIEEQDDDTDGFDGASRLSFNDELRQRGFVDGDDNTLSANVAQSDACHVTIEFVAEQCRHNTETEVSTGI
ncbi:hypothetical protein [Haloarchaeobius sp. DFWS5]|uniref:hypothetical protein n=1 Tax=Haloarchaeobius sp. DFWS5 TaxID=3446114 RepID=UPI003EB864D4